ncbi:hypothetical protein [Halomonas sp. 3A7M]|uniref:hypothetical protein n=1 Tax=Halomonas sp. 3A7M TaxID=2742616 RepID=UPI001868070C|nr:hypothetical protein [Halomonas sp. 3A7M]
MTRNKSEGVSLAAIVAKETTHGKWSGSGGGIGFGTGGIGLFVGGMSGTKTDQSIRAKELKGPDKPSFNWWYIYAPAFALIFAAIVTSVGSQVVTSIPMSGSVSNPVLENVEGSFADMAKFVGYVIGPLLIVCSAIYVLFFSGERSKEANARFDREGALFEIKKTVYLRLRYVEADHVVFDPDTGEEVPAERDKISALLERLATKEAQQGEVE